MTPAQRYVQCGCFVLLFAPAIHAQATPPKDSVRVLRGAVIRQGSPDRSVEERVFPPELVLQNQDRIALRPEQRDAVRAAMRATQAKTLETQWKLQDETDRLADMLKRTPVGEAEALAQVDRVLSAEREVKRAQMVMLIRVKNLLTAEQQEALRKLRAGPPS